MPHDDTYLNVSVDPLGGLKSIILGNFLSSEVPARKYYYNKFNTIKKDLLKIQYDFISNNNYCGKCPNPNKFRENKGLRGKDLTEDGLPFYYNPPPDFLGNQYAGIVVVMGRPASPASDPKYRTKDRIIWNRSIMHLVEEFYKNPTGDNFRILNNKIGDFIPWFKIVEENIFAFSKWNLNASNMAFLNVYKCRTAREFKPQKEEDKTYVNYCMNKYFIRQIYSLEPNLIIYLSKEIYDVASKIDEKGPKFNAENACYIQEKEENTRLPDGKNEEILSLVNDALFRRYKGKDKATTKTYTENLIKAKTSFCEDIDLIKIDQFSNKEKLKIRIAENYSDSENITKRVMSMTERTADLSSEYLQLKDDDTIKEYMEQACYAYIHSLDKGTAILCRSIVERAIRKKLNKIGDKITLYELINEFTSKFKISPVDRDRIFNIKEKGDNCAHNGTKITQNDALFSIQDTKKTLRIILKK